MREDLRATTHAQIRIESRRISPDTLGTVMEYGRELHRARALFYFLGRRDIPEHLAHDAGIEKMVGTVLVFSADGTRLLTGYKNGSVLHKIKRKTRYSRTAEIRARRQRLGREVSLS